MQAEVALKQGSGQAFRTPKWREFALYALPLGGLPIPFPRKVFGSPKVISHGSDGADPSAEISSNKKIEAGNSGSIANEICAV